MIMSEQSKSSRGLQALVLLAALVVLPLGFAGAQGTDVDAGLKGVSAKLEQAVKDGKMTPAEAKQKLAELRKENLGKGADQDVDADWEGVRAKLEPAVNAGSPGSGRAPSRTD